MQTKHPSGKAPLIFDHQQTAFQKLHRAGKVCFSPHRTALPIQPRTNSLVIGPSGCGKSFLARAVAESFGLECKCLTVAEWVIQGSSSKGSQRTWNAMFEFLRTNRSKKGVVIFIDEIDKLTGTTDWAQHLRVEVFRLLDLFIPPDLVDADENRYSQETFNDVENFLKHRTFIIGAGAFQPIWEAETRRVGGFRESNEPNYPSQESLGRHLATEIVNRFRADLVVLEPLRAPDYEAMLLATAEAMPLHLQQRFLRMGERRVPKAICSNQGVRFLEELVADVLAEDHPETTIQPVPIIETRSLWHSGPKINPTLVY